MVGWMTTRRALFWWGLRLRLWRLRLPRPALQMEALELDVELVLLELLVQRAQLRQRRRRGGRQRRRSRRRGSGGGGPRSRIALLQPHVEATVPEQRPIHVRHRHRRCLRVIEADEPVALAAPRGRVAGHARAQKRAECRKERVQVGVGEPVGQVVHKEVGARRT